MYNITLISTRHDEVGKSSSDELYKIFEKIKPDLFFEELPPSIFDLHYISKTKRNLETDTITRYLETHEAKHIPIDLDPIPHISFFEDHRYINEEIECLSNINGINYRKILDGHRWYSDIYGFQYLNSNHCIDIFDKLNDTIEKALQERNSERFFNINNSWNEWIEKREHEMLNNIIKYSNNHNYNNAIFTLGASHRKSIIQKIQKIEENKKSKINWLIYNGIEQDIIQLLNPSISAE